MPRFKANMNYIPPSPPSSMKQCNKSATAKFHMELHLTTTTRNHSRSGGHLKDPEDRIFNLNISDIFVVLREAIRIISDSIETGSAPSAYLG